MNFIVFAKIEAAREKEAYLSVAEISKLPGVKGVYLTFGGHDFVVIHEAPDLLPLFKQLLRLEIYRA